MAITITVDNDRTTTPPYDPLLLDETAGVQTPATTDDGNEINVTLTAEVGGSLGGFQTAFNTFLNSAALGLTDAQKIYARDHDGASSASNFVLVTTSAGETINDLFFANASGGALAGVLVAGMLTLDGQSVYLWSNGNFGSSSDFCVATTSSTAGAGEVVAAFYLNEAVDHKSAQVQMVVFEPLEHNNDGLDPDDALNFTDALRVGASGSLSFDFDQLASQSSLWVAVGNSSEAVLITGSSPKVDNTTGKKTNVSDVIHTSQGGAGATIGVNNQLFDIVGESATFTLVTGLQGLVGADAGVLSDYVIDDPTSGGIEQGIAYDGYLQNILGAGIFISQDQGSPNATKSLDINVFATNNAGEEEGFGYVYSNPGTKTGNALTDDIAVNVTTVSVRDNNGVLVGTWVLGADPDGAGPLQANGATAGGVQVTITGNNIDVNNFGIQYTISWTTATAFNRFNVVNEAGKWDIGRVDVDRTVPSNTPIGDKLYVEDDGPTAGSPVLKHVDEDAMTGVAGSDLSTGHIEAPADADGIAGEQDEVTFSQADLAAAVNSGTDAPAVFSLNASLADGTAVKTVGNANVFSQGDQVFYRTVGGVIQGVTDAGTADERIIFTITRNDNALIGDPSDDTFTFDLKDQLDHANASGELSLLTLNVSPAFSAKDSDNDPANLGSLIRVEVENDTPRADGDTVSKEVHEDALTGGNIDAGDPETKVVTVTYTKADLNSLATTGADENLTFSLDTAVIGTNVVTTGGANVQSGGVNVVWAAGATPGSLKGVISGTSTTVFTLTPSGDDFVFTLVDQVDHSGAENDLELLPIDLTSAFKAVDFDLDPLTLNADSVVLNVENDLPIFNGQIVSQTLDWVNNGFVTGSLFGKVGADDPASYIIDKYTDLAGYVETLSGDGKTLTYSIAGTTYFTLALSDSANSGAGGYTFTVNQPPPQPVLELNFQDLDSGQNLFGTVAFNKANIDNHGTPGDPTDDFLPDGGLMTFPTNIDINDGEAGESNDGTMTNTSGTTNTSKGGGPVTIGNSNQAFDNAGEGAWFAYVDNPETESVSGVGLNANLADDADNVRFDGMVDVTKASVEIVQASGAGTTKRPGPAMLITAYDINPGHVDSSAESRAFVLDPSATGDQANIIGVKIYDANHVLIEYRVNADAGATNTGILQDIPGPDDSAVVIQFNLDDNGGTPADPTDDIYSALVSNLKANYTIEWETEGDHNAAKVERAAGSYDIGGFNLLQGQDTADIDFDFSVAIQDKDGDLIHFGTTNDVFDDFRIKVDGTGSFNDPANVAPDPFLTSYDVF